MVKIMDSSILCFCDKEHIDDFCAWGDSKQKSSQIKPASSKPHRRPKKDTNSAHAGNNSNYYGYQSSPKKEYVFKYYDGDISQYIEDYRKQNNIATHYTYTKGREDVITLQPDPYTAKVKHHRSVKTYYHKYTTL